MKILLFDKDVSYARGLRYFLQQAGHQVLLVSEADSLPEAIKEEAPDCLIVGREMIEIAGTRPFHAIGAPVPLPLVIPIRREEPKLVDLKDSETDDSSTVYSDIHRQQAEAILNRFRQLRRGEVSLIRVGALSLNFERRRVLFHGKLLALTPLQFKLLSALALSAGHVVAYSELLEQVWGFEDDDLEARKLLKVHINDIRQRMKATVPEEKPYIRAVRGFGYTLYRPDKDASEN